MRVNNQTKEFYDKTVAIIDKLGLSAEWDLNRYQPIYLYDSIKGEDLVYIIDVKYNYIILLDRFGSFIAEFNNIIEMIDFICNDENVNNSLINPFL